ncbi:L-rhamnose-binding lectin CSL2-like [Genypterus blacodes]|uniref:L-rhamnose-binding lectin CSL2-like n=1 Tax=Genypterus blacodes TaxID=154954 RepID=UPI003F76AC68
MSLLVVLFASCTFWVSVSADNMLTCDLQNERQRLNCGHELIVVHSVKVSHRESESCVDGFPPAHLAPPLCSATPVYNLIAKRCNGRHSCRVSMDSCHMSTPCSRRCVWMDTKFSCVPGEIKHVCQRKKAKLDCGTWVIRVLMANYGRSSKRVCRYHAPSKQPAETSCRQRKSLKLMSHKCDGKHRCAVQASNSFFSNPCPGTRKYLAYSYICQRPERESEED